jgi:glutamine amidotransferase
LVVPHVGWNQVEQVRNHPLFDEVANQSHFYFVHSYFCDPVDDTIVAGETEYGLKYASVVARQNICGVQFHPEKSQNAGLQLLKNFAHLN